MSSWICTNESLEFGAWSTLCFEDRATALSVLMLQHEHVLLRATAKQISNKYDGVTGG